MQIKYGLYYQYKLNKNIFGSNFCSRVKLVKDVEHIDTSSIKVDKTRLSLLLKDDRVDCFVYYEDDIPVGILCTCRGRYYIRGLGVPFDKKNDSCYIFWIYVSQHCRKNGVLQELLHSCCSYHSLCVNFELLVSHDNYIMKTFLEKRSSLLISKILYLKLFHLSLFITNIKLLSANYCLEYNLDKDYIKI